LIGYGDSFTLAFYSAANDAAMDRVTSALQAVETITCAACRLLPNLPREVAEHLALTDGALADRDNWWRVVFHLAWHFPRPFLEATRWRLFTKDGQHFSGKSCETFVQLNGAPERHDLFPGTIFSVLEDLCYCSEASIKVIVEALELHAKTEESEQHALPGLSSNQRRIFDRLKSEFLAGTGLPVPQLECKLLMLDNSFETPPAREWAALQQGGCHEKMPRLSRLNDLQQIVQIRGPATEWFCRVAERAGDALPIGVFPECPILYERIHRNEAGVPVGRIGGPRPVVNRGPLERWIGFVFAVLHQQEHPALQLHWQGHQWLHYGFATLDRDLFAACALAIDLARLTTAAEAASNRERASCSPFSVPSMEEQGFQWAAELPSPPPPPESYTLGQLLRDLRQFGETYHQTGEQIRQQNPAVQRGARLHLGVYVSAARDSLQRIAGFNELRALVQSLWGEEFSFAVSQRVVEALVQRSNGRLSPSSAEGLTLAEALSQLSAPPDPTQQEPVADTLPPADGADVCRAGAELLRLCGATAGNAESQNALPPADTPAVPATVPQPAADAPKTPVEIFFSYSHKDEKLRNQLEAHLSQLMHQGLIAGWHDRKIAVGAEWEGQIDGHLNSARVILLLISADFLASRYCYDVEMKRALERHSAGEARVVPIILRPCDWHASPFGKLKALPKDAKPVTDWQSRDKAFTDVALGIRAAVTELTTQP